jgi:K+-transporting ATPase ATPase B chain
MRERFEHLRVMGIRTVMITGDNPLTAAAIARSSSHTRLQRATPKPWSTPSKPATITPKL